MLVKILSELVMLHYQQLFSTTPRYFLSVEFQHLKGHRKGHLDAWNGKNI